VVVFAIRGETGGQGIDEVAVQAPGQTVGCAAALKHILRFPDNQPLHDALEESKVSPRLESNLKCLLTLSEIREVSDTVRLQNPWSC
jgi:hypothetical protein